MANPNTTDVGSFERAGAPRLPRSLERRPKLTQMIGVLSLLLGLVALIFPFVAALATNLVIGAVLASVGLVGIIHAVRLKGAEGWLMDLAGGILALTIGLLLLVFPLPGILSLALLLVAFFFTQGVLRLMTALRHRGEPGWGWLLAVAVLEIVLGVFVLTGFPGAAVWLLGVLLGVDLVFNGVGLIMFARSGRGGRGRLNTARDIAR